MAAAPPTTYEMAYAVHTRTCTYLLDEEGVCRWIVSPEGVVPSHVRQAIGAQFVACLDLTVEGGLVGDLRIGGMALFVRHSDPTRMVLMRTAPIMRVDDRRGLAGERLASQPLRMDDKVQQQGRRAGASRGAGPSFGIVQYTGAEQTITLNLGLDADPGHHG